MNAAAPELGPWLGVVAGARPRPAPGGVALDDIRLALVSRLFLQARAPDPDWLAAWSPAVRATTARLEEYLRLRVAQAAATSRAPARVVRQAEPTGEDLQVMAARLDAAGIPLEAAVAAGAAGAGAFPRIGGAVEEAWLGLEATVASIATAWIPRIDALEAWRRPVLPLWVASGVLVLVAVVAGAWLGGYLPSPAWFAPVHDLWWSLPWP